MKIQLSEHFTYNKLLRFVFPSIVMMIFTSIYSVVDGLFVSNFVGKTALASINLIFPFLMGLSALGFMIGTGGSAIVAKTLGEGDPKRAQFLFFHACLCDSHRRHHSGIARHAFGPVRCFISRCRRRTSLQLHFVWPHQFYFHACLYAAKCIPEFLCDCGKTKAWTGCHHYRRCHQYDSGSAICRHPWLRSGGCRRCNRLRRDDWRTFSYILFFQKKQQSAPSWENTVQRPYSHADLRQRFFGTYD